MSDRPLQNVQDTVRIPFYGTENIHNERSINILYDQVFQNLIPQYHMDGSTQTKDQTLVKRPGISLPSSIDFMGGKVNNALQCTVIDAIAITAVYDVFVVAVFDYSNSTIYVIQIRPVAGTSTLLGSFAPAGASVDDFCFLTEITTTSAGSSLPAFALSWTKKDLSISRGYYAISGAGVFAAASLTQITSTGFPPNQTPALISIGKFVWLNGRAYIASLDGRIWNCALNDITTWSGGVVAAQAYPDQLIGLERFKHHVVAFGRNSVEFFNDVGNDPGPLQPTDQAFIKFGAKSPRLCRNINDILYWIGYGVDGVVGLWQLDGYTPVKLSTAFIDGFISGDFASTDPATYNMQAVTMWNKAHLIINGIPGGGMATMPSFSTTLPTGVNGLTDAYPLTVNDFTSTILCYNIEDKTFWTMQVQGDYNLGLRVAGTEFATPTTSAYYRQYLFYNSPESYISSAQRHGQQYPYSFHSTLDLCQDSIGDASATNYPNVPVTTVAQTNQMWFGNEKRKRLNRLKVINYVGSTSTSGVVTMYVFYTRDQAVFTTEVANLFQSRGFAFPNSNQRYYLNNLGTGRCWSFIVVEKSKIQMTLKALELDIQQGSH